MILGRIATCVLLIGIVLTSWILEFSDSIKNYESGWIPYVVIAMEHVAFIYLAMEWLIRGGYI